MKNYRPLLLRELALQIPGCRCRRLSVNRHLPHVDRLSSHSHPFSQIIVYVRGMGTIRIAGEPQAVTPGSVVLIPPKLVHAFDETGVQRALCLVLDLDWVTETNTCAQHQRLTASQLSSIRSMLSEIMALGDPGDVGNRFLVSAAVLRILDTIMRGLGEIPPTQRRKSAMVTRVDRILSRSAPDISIRDLADQLGLQPDYLNRAFKSETGLTLREHRDKMRVENARRRLRAGSSVRDAAENAGFLDLNYFTRWFKKWTGTPPATFRRESGH